MKPKTLVALWAVLLFLLSLSLLLGFWGNVVLSTILIFVIAVAKAFLVGAYYMRLKWEPWYILWILLGGVVCLLILYFALVPDIIRGP
ncbi:MAG: hypothetical protein HY539_02860 [Deltaproteobacteria bacterium]|nr:hypothetical protein [Deltaproteobacteria bacterium]